MSTEMVEKFLGGMGVAAVTKKNYKVAISGFFSWCIRRPRRWRTDNPALLVEIDQPERGEPKILTVDQVEKLLRAAEVAGLANYVALGVFAGLRPFEIVRLKREKVNLKDREIRIEGVTSKTGRTRVVRIDDTLLRWLKRYQMEPIFPKNFQAQFEKVVKAAGIKWVVDCLRHTSISHYFRKSGSYGLTAEFFGNSESIIKQHYQGRVSSAETEKFYALKPTK
ncbi:MAG TPA: tyrosine-type recombinase/integrase [Verrucomicrobiae bacterium]|nr:tyrosine-type recombinase/integrase [Verrucomicrobiae bacterium]